MNEADLSWFENKRVVGLSSGASVQEKRIEEAIDYFKKIGCLKKP